LLTITPLFYNEKLGFSEATIGLLISVAAFTSLTTMVPSGILADRHGRKLPFVLSLVLSGLVMPLFLLPTDLLGVALVYALYGLTLGLQGPMAAWSTDLSEKQALGTAMGLYRTISDIGFLLGPTVLTAVAGIGMFAQSYDVAFFFAMVWMLVTANIVITADDPVGRNAKALRLAALGHVS
jgi:DHA1 family multidrug resistance protein-like MFS transporter